MVTPTVETKIWQALKTRVQSLPVVYSVAYPAEADFDKPTDTDGPLPYIECRHLINNNVRFLIGSDDPDDRAGILQLTLNYPVASKHTIDVMLEIAGQIAAHFPKDNLMSFQDVTVRVERAPDVVQPYREESYWQIPVSVRWRCYA